MPKPQPRVMAILRNSSTAVAWMILFDADSDNPATTDEQVIEWALTEAGLDEDSLEPGGLTEIEIAMAKDWSIKIVWTTDSAVTGVIAVYGDDGGPPDHDPDGLDENDPDDRPLLTRELALNEALDATIGRITNAAEVTA